MFAESILAFTLVLASLLCTLVAAFVLLFAIVVMPGIGTLSKSEFLQPIQVMDGVHPGRPTADDNNQHSVEKPAEDAKSGIVGSINAGYRTTKFGTSPESQEHQPHVLCLPCIRFDVDCCSTQSIGCIF